jgi:signal transduction histidine kinase
MREAIVSLKGVIQEKKIHTSLEIKDSGFEFYGDRDMLFQVFINLLSNAIKFTRNQVGIVFEKDLEKGETKIIIEDNGKGIPEDLHAAIFDKFYQVKNKNINKPQGSGLGLAITQKIVELHNGKIWVENKAGEEGAKFVFALPINPQKDE